MNFTKSDLSLAFGLTDENNVFYKDLTIFSFVFKQNYLDFSNGVTLEKEFELKSCEPSDFINHHSDFYKMGLNK